MSQVFAFPSKRENCDRATWWLLQRWRKGRGQWQVQPSTIRLAACNPFFWLILSPTEGVMTSFTSMWKERNDKYGNMFSGKKKKKRNREELWNWDPDFSSKKSLLKKKNRIKLKGKNNWLYIPGMNSLIWGYSYSLLLDSKLYCNMLPYYILLPFFFNQTLWQTN